MRGKAKMPHPWTLTPSRGDNEIVKADYTIRGLLDAINLWLRPSRYVGYFVNYWMLPEVQVLYLTVFSA